MAHVEKTSRGGGEATSVDGAIHAGLSIADFQGEVGDMETANSLLPGDYTQNSV